MSRMDKIPCPRCHSDHTFPRKYHKGGKISYQCKDCKKAGKPSYFTAGQTDRYTEESEEVEYGRDYINVICASTRILTEEDIIQQFKIDTTRWELDKFTVKTSEGYRKDRQVQWEISNGVVTSGKVNDSGKMLVVPMYHVKASFILKKDDVRNASALQDMLEDAKNYAPKYEPINYPKYSDGMVYELDMPDLHFGKLAWAEETGQDYDIGIAADSARYAFLELLSYVKSVPVSKILLPLGNDFFNVNGAGETTMNGTKQTEDTRWQKTFRNGRRLLVSLVDLCAQVAPVDVVIVPGNHDRERMFYLGDALECWYHDCPNVTVDNGAALRKFRAWGKNMVMFTHGSEEKFPMLPGIMANEQPAMWGQALHREAHVADRHHKEVLIENVKEVKGVTIRLMRSLTPPDEWHYRTGWLGAEQAAESYLWDQERGVVGQFTSVRV